MEKSEKPLFTYEYTTFHPDDFIFLPENHFMKSLKPLLKVRKTWTHPSVPWWKSVTSEEEQSTITFLQQNFVT